MFYHWRRSPFVLQMPSYETPGDPAGGGGGDDLSAHPDYDVDFGGGGGDDPPSPPAPGAPATPPVQDPSRQPGDPGQDPRTPAVDPAAFATLQANHTQLQTQLGTVLAQNQRLLATIGALTGREPGPAAPAGDQPPLSEGDKKAIAAVKRLFPKLGPLLDAADDLLAVPGQVKSFSQGEESRWKDLGSRMWQAFDGEVKKAYPTGTIHPFAQKVLDSSFVSWLETDANAAARYRMGDTTLAAEFMTMYMNGVVVPAQRARQAPGAPGAPAVPGQPPRRATQPPRVPRGGAGAAPVPGQPPAQPNVKKPDELHDAAADAFFAQQQ